jgi:hypothetical protein
MPPQSIDDTEALNSSRSRNRSSLSCWRIEWTYFDRARRVSWIFVKRVRRVVEYMMVSVRVTAGRSFKMGHVF